MAKDTRWDRNLSVAPDADGLIGHAGAVLLRKLADQCGLTSALGAALGRKGKFPLIDRGIALVSIPVVIALGSTTKSGSPCCVSYQNWSLGPRLYTTVRRTLERADPRTRTTRPGAARSVPDARGRSPRRRPGSRGWPSPGSCWRAGWSSTWTRR